MDQSFNWPNISTNGTASASQVRPVSALNLAILASSPSNCEAIRSHAEETGLVRIRDAVTTNCIKAGDSSVYRLTEARPAAIVVDLHDPGHAIRSLEVLSFEFPETTLIFCCAADDSPLLLSAMRAGAQEFILKPVSGTEFHEVLTRLIENRTIVKEEATGGKILSVISAKGGSGATSVSINLAFELSKLQETRVALVDLDRPMGDTAGYLGLSSQFTVMDALADTHRLDRVLLDSFMVNRDGVDVLPGMREQRPGLVPSAEGLFELFEVLRTGYTHSVVDLSSTSDEPCLETIIRLSADLIVVLTPELPCLWRTDWLIQLLSALGGEDKLRLVVNRSHPNDEIRKREVEDTLRHPVYWDLPNDYGTAIESINRGKPLSSMGNSALADSYTELAHKLAGVSMEKRRNTLVSLFSF